MLITLLHKADFGTLNDEFDPDAESTEINREPKSKIHSINKVIM